MASKLGELERRGACNHPVFGAAVCPPVFPEVPSSAGPQHFCSMFGLQSVFTGCSVVGRVVLRCRAVTGIMLWKRQLLPTQILW
jgi:hypothetical protein